MHLQLFLACVIGIKTTYWSISFKKNSSCFCRSSPSDSGDQGLVDVHDNQCDVWVPGVQPGASVTKLLRMLVGPCTSVSYTCASLAPSLLWWSHYDCMIFVSHFSGSWMCWSVTAWEFTMEWKPWPGCRWSPTSGRACGTFLHISMTTIFLTGQILIHSSITAILIHTTYKWWFLIHLYNSFYFLCWF